ncbi:hypothetical protein [Streptomyces chilikensis]|uniref:hypothetical protein n=1 Tax=Streptomyces chilikensis TaxID=1194079 RepID=UPI000A614C46|nr:hypothetical protein [Streptomyces chilikensis]
MANTRASVDRDLVAIENAFADRLTVGTITMDELLRRVLVAAASIEGGSHGPTRVSRAIAAVAAGRYA